MGKFEIQSMPMQKSDNNYICAHSTCKGQFFNENSSVLNSGFLSNGASNESCNGVNKSLTSDTRIGFTRPVIAQDSLACNNNRLEVADEMDEILECIPQGMKVFRNQVSGHIIEGCHRIGMLTKDGLTYKPMLKKECAMREIMFYEHLKNALDRSLTEIQHLVPKYYGVEKLQINGKEIDFLILEDLTKGFKEPCVMDIKIGRRTWDPNANPDKIRAEQRKYLKSKRDLGFCIPGFQVYKIINNQLIKFDKTYGKDLDKDGVREAIKIFLNADTHYFCRKLLVQLLAPLWQIQHFARTQRRFRLYSSSILLVYDARRLRTYAKLRIPAENTDFSITATPPKRTQSNLVRQGSLYRPISLAQLNNDSEKIPTGFSGQLTHDGPILKPPSNKVKNLVNMEMPRVVNYNNTWQKSMHTLKRTHSFQNNYDKDVQNKKQDYTFMLDDLCSENQSEVWATAKLIDFAHVYITDNVDQDKNYIEGIESLSKMFEEFLYETDED